MRKVISKLSIVDGTLSCKDRSGKFIPIQKTQGDLDGACATYSVIMNLLLLGVIFDSDTKVESKPKDKNTRKLIKTFFADYGMHHDGRTYFKIKKMLLSSFGKVVDCVHYVPNDEDVTIETIKKNIDEDCTVVISIAYRIGGGHALLAVGYEVEDNKITKILCLDPGSPKVRNKRWNATVDLYTSSRCNYRHTYSDETVSLEDILIITKK